jgi:poly(A) polymerase
LEEARQIIKILIDSGHNAFFVGGCVRDKLIGKNPKDFDVVTSATPEQIKSVFDDVLEIGAQFAITPVRIGEEYVEVATMREESEYVDGRHPNVIRYTDSVEKDAERRDFTINSMFEDLDGNIVDLHGGQDDVKRRLIKCVGDPRARFTEDALRMVRAIRFACVLDFMIDPEALKVIQELSPTISQVSNERIREELNKSFKGDPYRTLGMLTATELLPHILPEINDLMGVEQSKEHHPEGDVFNHVMHILKHYGNLEKSDTLTWAILLHDVSKKETQEWNEEKGRWTFYGHDKKGAKRAREICRRFGMSNKEVDQICNITADHMRMHQISKFGKKKLNKLMMQPHFEELLAFARLDALGSNGDLTQWEWATKKWDEFQEEKENMEKDLLQGRDLIQMGFEPGPNFKKILDKVKDAQLSGFISTKEEAVKFIEDMTALFQD